MAVRWPRENAFLTSSGYQTPGFVLPSKTAVANAAIEVPTLLKPGTHFINDDCHVKLKRRTDAVVHKDCHVPITQRPDEELWFKSREKIENWDKWANLGPEEDSRCVLHREHFVGKDTKSFPTVSAVQVNLADHHKTVVNLQTVREWYRESTFYQ